MTTIPAHCKHIPKDRALGTKIHPATKPSSKRSRLQHGAHQIYIYTAILRTLFGRPEGHCESGEFVRVWREVQRWWTAFVAIQNWNWICSQAYNCMLCLSIYLRNIWALCSMTFSGVVAASKVVQLYRNPKISLCRTHDHVDLYQNTYSSLRMVQQWYLMKNRWRVNFWRRGCHGRCRSCCWTCTLQLHRWPCNCELIRSAIAQPFIVTQPCTRVSNSNESILSVRWYVPFVH